MARNALICVTSTLFPKGSSLLQSSKINLGPFLGSLRSHTSQARESNVQNSTPQVQPKWDLFAAVCLERKPIITRPLNDLEKDFAEMLTKIEVEASLKSDHEKRHEMDLKRADRLRKGSTNEADLEQAALQTAQDYEDACLEEFNKFQPASRTTKADETGDQKSLNRLLDRHLLLAVCQTVGEKKQWGLPQIKWTEGETLRQTAERALASLESSSRVRFMGNAPSGVHKIKYPASVRKQQGGSVGAKVFFFKAHLLDHSFQIDPSKEYRWLGRSELKTHLQTDYLRSVEECLIDED